MIYVGVDPGCEGGIACVGDVVGAWKIPLNADREPRHAAILSFFGSKEVIVAIEEQFLIPRHRGEKEKLTNFGILLGLFQSFAVAVYRVPWNEWQPYMAPGAPKGNGHKAFLVKRAKRLFPDLKIGNHSGMADSLLLAEYCRFIAGQTGKKGNR